MKISRFVSLTSTVVAVSLLSACTEADVAPTTATVIVEADAADPVVLIVSSRFEVIASGEIVFTNADTISISENYSEIYAMNEEGRFTAKLLNEGDAVEDVRLSVLLDDRLEYDERAAIVSGGFLQYVYRFQSAIFF